LYAAIATRKAIQIASRILAATNCQRFFFNGHQGRVEFFDGSHAGGVVAGDWDMWAASRWVGNEKNPAKMAGLNNFCVGGC
jgi:hypothetical protein